MFSRDQARHDENFKKFTETEKKGNLVFNESKCVFSTKTISILDSVVSKGEIKPDPDRLKRLQELPAPVDCLLITKKNSWVFSIFTEGIRDFSKKIKHISQNVIFPLHEESYNAFNLLKGDIEKCSGRSNSRNLSFLT